MSARLRSGALVAASLIGSILGCFSGAETLGAVCYADNQCGVDQRCVNSLCGLCNNLEVDAGELCFGNSSEENVFGEVTDLVAYDPENDGFGPLVIATVNTNCASPPQAGPPQSGQPSCWFLYGLNITDDADFEAFNILVDDETMMDVIGDGRIPQLATGNFDGASTTDVAMAIYPNDAAVDPSQLIVIHNLFLDPNGPSTLVRDISSQPSSIHAADLNGDGLDDILIGGQVSSSPEIIIASPGEGFQNAPLVAVDAANTCPRFADPVDMDNDGDLDVPMVANGSGVVAVYLNNGDGLLSSAGGQAIGADFICNDQAQLDDPRPQSGGLNLATADFDRDGNEDVVVFLSRPNQSEIQVYRGLGDGTLELDATLPGGELPVSGLATDINHDGWSDIIVADLGEDRLPVHINRGGSFPDIVTIDVAASPRALMYEDADFNDIPDLIVGNANGVVAIVPSEN